MYVNKFVCLHFCIMIQALLKYVILFWQGLLKTHNATVKLKLSLTTVFTRLAYFTRF